MKYENPHVIVKRDEEHRDSFEVEVRFPGGLFISFLQGAQDCAEKTEGGCVKIVPQVKVTPYHPRDHFFMCRVSVPGAGYYAGEYVHYLHAKDETQARELALAKFAAHAAPARHRAKIHL